jgi:diguanylate cyclase (GGDEF)-like protein
MNVVLVDPSRTVLRIVMGLLEGGDHGVHPFTDAQQALDYTKSDPTVQALITSAELTSMSGLELCRQARKVASCGRPIYVILMSSNKDRRTLIEALDNGADDFIGKPPVIEELYARLRAADRVGSMQRQLLRLAATDSLTGILNRRAFFDEAREACAQANAGRGLCAVMLDIDHFKRINDIHGHDIGDEAIRGVTREAAATPKAILGRLGGEEFAVLLMGRTLAEAVVVADDLRLRLAGLQFETGNEMMTLTCSFGVSEWQAGDSIDQLLKRADVALYKAKTDGRNRVVAYSPELSSINCAASGRVVRAAVA